MSEMIRYESSSSHSRSLKSIFGWPAMALAANVSRFRQQTEWVVVVIASCSARSFRSWVRREEEEEKGELEGEGERGDG